MIFSKYVESLGAPSPRIWAVIVKGRIQVLGEDGYEAGWPWLCGQLTQNRHGVVLKPIMGLEGIGIAFLKKYGSKYQLNGCPVTEKEMATVIAQLDDYLITEFVVQHEYSACLYPRTTNTIRLLTLWDYETHRPFLATAVHRIGSARSYPVDSFKSGAGGLSARIDLATGMLSRPIAAA